MKRRNLLLPIHRLPVEIVCTIIHSSVSQYSEVGNFSPLSQLRGVSKIWRSYIDSCPRLWAYVNSSRPLLYTLKTLEMSNGAPLNVTYNEYNNGDRIELCDFMNAAGSHLARWKTASLSMSRSYQPLRYLESPAPLIRRVSIECPYPFDVTPLVNPKPLNLFGDEAPMLEDVHISWAFINWNSNIFKGLKALSVTSPLNDSFPSASQFLRILIGSPQLENLSLNDAFQDNFSEFTTSSVCLPKLQRLCLVFTNLTPVLSLLRILNIPPLERLDIECDIDHVPESLLLKPLAAVISSSFSEAITGRNKAMLHISKDNITFRMQSESHRLSASVRLMGNSALSVFTVMEGVCETLQSLAVKVWVEPLSGGDIMQETCFPPIWNIITQCQPTILFLRKISGIWLETFMESMFSPLVTGEWPLSNLIGLIINDAFHFDVNILVDMLTRRRTSYTPQPVALQFLQLHRDQRLTDIDIENISVALDGHMILVPDPQEKYAQRPQFISHSTDEKCVRDLLY